MLLFHKILCFILLLHFRKIEAQTRPADNPLLPKCSLPIMDVTLSSHSTDALQIMLVKGMAPFTFKTFNISRALDIISSQFFKKHYRTVLYAHGFTDIPGSLLSVDIAEAYTNKGGYNILLLNSNPLLSGIYFRAARATKYIGARLGLVLSQMHRSGLNAQTLELVGHSLGAHIVGFTGKAFRRATGVRLPFIAALDPAGPCFVDAGKHDALDIGDADFVEVLHTNAGDTGLTDAVGHVDFYVNGGKKQLGEKFFGRCSVVCSHIRVIKYWKAAITNPTGFVGVRCDNVDKAIAGQCDWSNGKKIPMGTTTDRNARGIYYLKTSNRYPYYLGEAGIGNSTRQ